MAETTGKNKPLTILFTCVGRRVELVQAFRAAAKRLDVTLHYMRNLSREPEWAMRRR